VGKADVDSFHWMLCKCRRHWRYLTIKGAHQRHNTVHCKVCPGGEQQLAAPGLEAAVVLDARPERWAYEARVLRGTKGPIDFYCPSLKLGVEVDGEQHYQGKMYGESFKSVQQRDWEKMCTAWGAGIRILRVPYFDACSFSDKLDKAVEECSAYPSYSFLMWSTDPFDEFGALQRRGETFETWLERVPQARDAAQVSAPSPLALNVSSPMPLVPVRYVSVWGPTAQLTVTQ